MPAVNQRVVVKNQWGTIRYIGPTEFAPGTWYGVELDEPKGKNDGSVAGVRYFACGENCGVFVRKSLISAEIDNNEGRERDDRGNGEGDDRNRDKQNRDQNDPRSRASNRASMNGLRDPNRQGRGYNQADRGDDHPFNVHGSPRADLSGSVLSPRQAGQSSHSLNIIEKLQSKLKITTQKLKGYHDQIGALEKRIAEHQEQVAILEEKLEMTTVDRDFQTEEKARLEASLSQLAAQYEELKTEYQLVKEEMELNRQIEDEVSAQMSSSDVDVEFLMVRNRKLEESLRSLHTLSSKTEGDLREQLQGLTEELKQKTAELDGFAAIKDSMEHSAVKLQSLQAQLDATAEMERVIEHMNLENDRLQEKISQLEATVQELNELHELDRSLEESQRQVENDLRSDIHSLLAQIKKDKASLAALDRTNRYMESKLAAYRKKTAMDTPDVSFVDDDRDNDHSASALRLQVTHFKMLNLRNHMASRIAQAKLSLAHEKLALAHYHSFRSLLDLVFDARALSAVLRVLESCESNSTSTRTLFSLLAFFVDMLIVNLECDTTSVLAPLRSSLSELTSKADKLVDVVADTHGVEPSFAASFMRNTVGFHYSPSSQLRFACVATRMLCDSAMAVVNRIRTASPLPALDALFKHIREVSAIEVPEVPEGQEIVLDFPLSSFVDHAIEIVESLRAMERDENNILGVEDTLENAPNLTRLFSEIAQSCNASYTTTPVEVHSVYTLKPPEEEDPSSQQLLDKDTRLQELQLNVELLENNMRTIHRIHEEKVTRLLRELKESKARASDNESRLQDLQEENAALLDQLHEMSKSNQIFENGDLLDTFDVNSGKALAAKMNFVDEMVVLRRLAAHNFDTGPKVPPAWLCERLLRGKGKEDDEFHRLATSLRDLVGVTRPGGSRLEVLAVQEGYLGYLREREQLKNS